MRKVALLLFLLLAISPICAQRRPGGQPAPRRKKTRPAAKVAPPVDLDEKRVYIPPPGWRFVGISSLNLAYFYNERTLTRSGDVVQVWIREDPVTERARLWAISVWKKIIKSLGPDGPDPLTHASIDKFAYETKLEEYDCAKRRTRNLDLSLRTRDGALILAFPSESKWNNISPDSLSELLLDAVCIGG